MDIFERLNLKKTQNFLFRFLFPEQPVSLQSLCRLAVRKSVGVFRLWRMSEIDLSPQITDYLLFREIFLSINQVVDQRDYDVIPKLNEVSHIRFTENLNPQPKIPLYKPGHF